jgi:ribosomal protein L24E
VRKFIGHSKIIKSLQIFILSLSLLFVSPGIFDAFQVYAQEPVNVSSGDPGNTGNTVNTGTAGSAVSGSAAGSAGSETAQIKDGQSDTAKIAKGGVVTIDQKVPGIFAETLDAFKSVADSTAVVATSTADAVKTDVTNLVTGKDMSKLEKVLWSIGKAVVPTLAVIAFAATVACPVTWLVVGAIAVGAVAGGGMSFLADMRANNFKEEGSKKATMDMVRDASIAAVSNAVAAPFTLVGGSLVAQAGKFTLTSLAKSAALQGATSFASTVASKTAGGLTKKAWYKHYYHNDDKIAAKQQELNTLLSKYENTTGDISQSDLDKMMELQSDIDALAKTDYKLKDWTKDVETGLISGVIGGCLGGAATHLAAQTTIARAASQKIFQNTGQAGTLANLVVSNPFNFATGAATAQVDKNFISKDIKELEAKRDALPADSPARKFYDDQIAGLQNKTDSINIWKSGTDTMLNSLVVNSASLGVSVAKARLYDIPKAKKSAVTADYQDNNPDWKSANDAKNAYLVKKGTPPKKADFKTASEYKAAKAAYDTELSSLKTNWKGLEKTAKVNDKLPENKELFKSMSSNYDQNKAIQQKIEMARIYGHDAYKKARMDVIKDQGEIETWEDGTVSFVMREDGQFKKRITLDPDDVQGSLDSKLGSMVDDTIKLEYSASSQAAQKSIDNMNKKLKDFEDLENGSGKLETWKDGSRHYVVRDKGKITKNVKIDPKYNDWKKDPQIRAIEAQAYTVKPSAFKANYVKKELDSLRAQGYTESQIKAQTPDIVKQADSAMVGNFGGSYFDCLKHEVLASELSKAKYDGNYNALGKTWQIIKSQPAQVRKKLLNEYIKTVNSEINSQITDSVDTGNEYSDKFLETFLTGASSTATSTAVDQAGSTIRQRMIEY